MLMFRKTHEALLKDITQEARGLGALAAKYKRDRNDAEVALAIARAEAEANKADAEAHRARLRRDREYHANRRAQKIDRAASGNITL